MAEAARGAVLVTGGAGYVGASAARALHAAGRLPVVLDDLSTGHRESVRWGPLVEGDVGDEALLRHTLRAHRIGAVLHFAARALVEESLRDPAGYDRANRANTALLAAVAREEGVRALVFSSTCAVYGEPREVPIPEDHPRAPVNPYGTSKAAAEDALLASGVPVALLRYFNAAGAEPEHGLGERHDPETHLVPRALEAARTGEPLVVHGTDWPTHDGTCVRDYVHVADLAEAHRLALDWLERGGPSRAWNLGTGRGASVLEVLAALGRATGRAVPWRAGPRRAGDPAVLVAAAGAASRDLGWGATRDLDAVARDAAAWAARAA